MKNIQILYLGILTLFVGSCKIPDTRLAVRQQQLPASFKGTTDTTTISNIDWQEYFADGDLVRLINSALHNNHDLQMALQRIEIARSGVQFASGERLPKIDAVIAAGVEKYARYTPDYAGNSTTEYQPGKIVPNPLQDYFTGFTAGWEIDIWNKLRNGHQAAVARYLSSMEGKNFVVSNLVAEVASFYYELLALDNVLEIVRETILKQEEALEVVRMQKEVGRANELAVRQFQAQLLHTRALEQESVQRMIEIENQINFLLGRFPQTIERTKENLFQEVPQEIASGIPFQMLAHRPDIREAEYLVQAGKFDVQSARAAFFPKINIGAALGFQAFQPQLLFSTPASIGYSALGDLVAPLVNRKALKAQFQTAKAQQLAAVYHYQKTILNGYLEVVNELSNIRHLQQIRSLKAQQNEVLEGAVEASTDFYSMAKANYLEVLTAQQNLLQAKLEWIDVSRRSQLARINIYKSLGGGW